ncbi:thiol:disulfide interchange protein DsbC [Roseateles asaccharophilus]|uniref:DsbC family protein n=1 Tax=Roseateles asaccharophilus TaxID=582607 RepID=UPI003839CD79
MKHPLRTVAQAAIAAAAVMLSIGAQAAGESSKVEANRVSAEKADIESIMKARLNMQPSNIVPAPMAGWYEVTVGANIYYVEKGGKWLFDGHLVDVATKTSVTAERKATVAAKELPALNFGTLNLADAIKTSRGAANPSRILVVFEDPNCGFCKRLHPELAKLQNVTIYTFPVSFLGEASNAKNEAVWCTKDRSASWATVMQGGAVKAEAECDTSAIKRNGMLAQRLVVSGTPTIFLADGTRIPGFVDATALEARLSTLK